LKPVAITPLRRFVRSPAVGLAEYTVSPCAHYTFLHSERGAGGRIRELGAARCGEGQDLLLDSLGDAAYSSLLDYRGECILAEKTDDRQMELLQGTLDLLILKAVSLGPLHGYGVLLRIQQISGQELVIQQGSLYPALYRLEHQGAITSEWGDSENNRRAKYYRLTAAGRRRLESETEKWNRMAGVIAGILRTTPESL